MSKNKITIYVKPTCTTCRKALKTLREQNAEFETVNYFEQALTKENLTKLIEMLNTPPRELLRKNEKTYKDLGLSKKDLSDEEIIDLMIKHPELLQRPIVQKGEKVILARPAEEIEQLL